MKRSAKTVANSALSPTQWDRRVCGSEQAVWRHQRGKLKDKFATVRDTLGYWNLRSLTKRSLASKYRVTLCRALALDSSRAREVEIEGP
jgi:hypothetical protein